MRSPTLVAGLTKATSLQRRGTLPDSGHKNLWYAHQGTCVWLQKWTPTDIKPYMERGWPFFEQAVASMITDSTKLVELNSWTVQCLDWITLHEAGLQ